jgi:hypothetical protein
MTSSLHVKTPLIFSQRLTKIFGKGPVYLKLENLQVPGLIFTKLLTNFLRLLFGQK